ncbi:MAG: Crp/Fnr family transcriptional regulator [Caulobacteraceae bacterium]|nr:Crp/Fnr family transcriptional regulator [Caulobacteraceae bacterium]
MGSGSDAQEPKQTHAPEGRETALATDSTIEKAMAANAILGLLHETARHRLAQCGSPVSLQSGALLCQRGDPGDAIFIVLEGEIEVRMGSAEGREVRLASFGRVNVVGEMAALDGGPRSADMVALVRTRLWRIPRGPLLETLEAEPAAAVALIAELAHRLRATNAALESMQTLDLGGRLAQLLLDARGERDLVPITQTEIARRLSASREKVNRKLHAWVTQGWVLLEPSGVRIRHPSALAGLAGRASPE